MLRSLTSAITGLQAFQQRMDVIGNNVANVNTTAFKGARVDLADSFSQTLRASSASNGGNKVRPAQDRGAGRLLPSLRQALGHGALARTAAPPHLALTPRGVF